MKNIDCKIIFIDIDGTLVNSEKKITSGVKEAIAFAIEKGIKIAIASGRPYHGTIKSVKALELDKLGGYVLAFNGGKIIDCKTNEVIYDVSLPFDAIKKAYELAKRFGAELITYKGDTILSENPDDEFALIESRINEMPLIKSENILEDIKDLPVKCLVVGDGDKLAEAEPVFREELRGVAKIFRSEPYFIEVMPDGIDKASSIANFIKKIGISREETLAFGDGFNDISMIEYCGTGVAMKNGCTEILEKADYITKYTNDEDGIAYFLKEHNII